MKKLIVSMLLLLMISLQITGCANRNTSVSTKENQSTAASSSKSERDIRKIAYDYLSAESKATIIDWQKAKVEEYKEINSHAIAAKDGQSNLKGKDTYRVTFRTDNEALLGPITVYIEKGTYRVLGIDYRR